MRRVNRWRALLGACVAGLFLLWIWGCGDDTTAPPAAPVNLLANGGFESGADSSLAGWTVDNLLTRFSLDTPPGGGHWSLSFTRTAPLAPGIVYSRVPDARDGDVLQLSAWARVQPITGGCFMAIVAGQSPQPVKSTRRVTSIKMSWTHLSLVDTVRVAAGDSVWVVLSPAHMPFEEDLGNTDFFDLVTLEKIGTAPQRWLETDAEPVPRSASTSASSFFRPAAAFSRGPACGSNSGSACPTGPDSSRFEPLAYLSNPLLDP